MKPDRNAEFWIKRSIHSGSESYSGTKISRFRACRFARLAPDTNLLLTIMETFVKTIFLAVIVLLVGGCTDSRNAERVLISAGYSDIEIQGYSFFGCSEDDVVRTKFTAKGVDKRQVSGAVCSGLLFKNSTIRFN